MTKFSECADGSAPVLCDKNECETRKCEGQNDVTCVVDPCNKCKVSFVDAQNKPVTCNGNNVFDICMCTGMVNVNLVLR